MSAFSVHDTACVESTMIGKGTQIWHFAHIRKGAQIGKNCIIGKSVYIDRDVHIGDKVKIQNFVSVYKGVTIEDDVFIGPSVTFTNDQYPRSFSWDDEKILPTHVCKGASIGANATVLCGLTIGAYAMIGAGSVVTKDIPDFGLVFGNPSVLEGFVCFCGKKLDKIISKNDKTIIYKCRKCNKKVEITV